MTHVEEPTETAGVEGVEGDVIEGDVVDADADAAAVEADAVEVDTVDADAAEVDTVDADAAGDEAAAEGTGDTDVSADAGTDVAAAGAEDAGAEAASTTAADTATATAPAEAATSVTAADSADSATTTPDPTTPENTPTPRPRTSKKRVWISVTASVLLAAGFATGGILGWQAFALDRVAAAQRVVTAASDKLTQVTDDRGMALDKAHGAVEAMGGYAAHPRPAYLAEAPAKEFTAAFANLEKVGHDLTYTPFDPPKVSARSADLWPWTVAADLRDKDELTRQEVATARTRAAELKALDAAQKRYSTASVAVYTQLAAHGEKVMTGDSSATYASKIVLRHAIDDSKDAPTVNGTALLRVISAIDGVDTAQAAGEAAKQDPAYPIREEIMAYARSIAHGITLDFEWHEVVNGYGEGWYSGTAMYHYDDGGWGTIDLNFGVQEGWARGDVDAKALVTHEVGHTQVVRRECEPLFTGPAFSGDDEMWATAWAIAMGFDTDGAGIQAYGRPTDEQIAVAGQCR